MSSIESHLSNTCPNQDFFSNPINIYFGTFYHTIYTIIHFSIFFLQVYEKDEDKKKESPKNSPKTTPKAPEAPKVDLNPWSKKEQKALEKALKKYPVSMDKKERWSAIAKGKLIF